MGDVRTPHTARLCEVCGVAVAGRRAGRVCSTRCRIARWRQVRAEATAATLARLHTENATLRQRVAELERLVGRLTVPPLADGDAGPHTPPGAGWLGIAPFETRMGWLAPRSSRRSTAPGNCRVVRSGGSD